MKNGIRQMKIGVFEKYILPFSGSLLFCIILIVKYDNEFNGYLFALFVSFLAVMLFSLVSMIRQIKEIDRFTSLIPDHHRIIDSTAFCDQQVFSFSERHLHSFSYDDIVKASHIENVFEKVIRPYSGKHQVTLLLKDQRVIRMDVADGATADRIVCYIRTVHPGCIVQGLQGTYRPVRLDELGNINYNSRF